MHDPPKNPRTSRTLVDGGSGHDVPHDVLDRSRRGAPAAGETVRDIFSTDEIFHRIVAQADEECQRSNRLLFFSGIAAGLSLGLTVLGQSAMTGASGGSFLVGSLLYPIGFIFITLGRYQLFTENTLTPVTLVLTRLASIPSLLRMWGIVLVANVLGAGLMGYGLASTDMLNPEGQAVAIELARHAVGMSFSEMMVRGAIAGWLVAGMVWIMHALRNGTARFLAVFLITYMLAVGDLAHCIVGSCEGLMLVFMGELSYGQFVFGYFSPVVFANTLGGVFFVAILNYAQTRADAFPGREDDQLSWREWLFSTKIASPHQYRGENTK